MPVEIEVWDIRVEPPEQGSGVTMVAPTTPQLSPIDLDYHTTMDSPAEPSPASESGLTPAQERARRQRERRQAKIQAGGASRLEAITSLSGRSAPAADTRTYLFSSQSNQGLLMQLECRATADLYRSPFEPHTTTTSRHRRPR